MLLFGFSFDWANYVSHSPHANLLAAAKADPNCLYAALVRRFLEGRKP